ncbi:DUF1127 domain-containing protein [Mesorhizobium sp. IMUNJ 23232]|uniref:DUF1127 domain-containing protein n=1 Tax=Mesorhizobium sp. IMUNJ 23232 TaxID=3376064 RepID=UPI003788EA15
MTTHYRAARATGGLTDLFGLLFSPWRPRAGGRLQRTELEVLNDHLLRDIGLTRLPNRLHRRD